MSISDDPMFKIFVLCKTFLGGFYSAHHDFAVRGQTFNDINGNRIATMLFYVKNFISKLLSNMKILIFF